MGTVKISGNAISRFITFSVPTSSLGGTPSSGWGFTVVLTGQGRLQPRPGPQLRTDSAALPVRGLCATASNDPHCTADPNSVPKVIDVLTPPGVSQSDEIDYTLHNPVTLQPITFPDRSVQASSTGWVPTANGWYRADWRHLDQRTDALSPGPRLVDAVSCVEQLAARAA